MAEDEIYKPTQVPEGEKITVMSRVRHPTIEVGRRKVKVPTDLAEVWRRYGELGQTSPDRAAYCIDRAVADLITKSLETSIIKSQRRIATWENLAEQARKEKRLTQAESLTTAVLEEQKIIQGMAIIADSLAMEGDGGKCPTGGLPGLI